MRPWPWRAPTIGRWCWPTTGRTPPARLRSQGGKRGALGWRCLGSGGGGGERRLGPQAAHRAPPLTVRPPVGVNPTSLHTDRASPLPYELSFSLSLSLGLTSRRVRKLRSGVVQRPERRHCGPAAYGAQRLLRRQPRVQLQRQRRARSLPPPPPRAHDHPALRRHPRARPRPVLNNLLVLI